MSERYPDLSKELSSNSKIKANEVSSRSVIDLLWICAEGHEYSASPANRVSGSACPYCSGRKRIKGINDLHYLHPELIKEWSHLNKITPENYSPKSAVRVYWECDNGHTWKTAIRARTQGSQCIYCTNQKVLFGYNDLETLHPEVMKFWSKNNKLHPKEIIPGTNKKYLWTCITCKNTWERQPCSLIISLSKNLFPCPFCNGNILLSGFNDLLTHQPELAREWSSKNQLDPNEVTYNYGHSVYWICKLDHVWKARIDNRLKGTGCGRCSNRVSKLEKELQLFIEQLLPFEDVVFNDRKEIKPKELDVFIPEKHLAIEFNGDFWHSDSQILKTTGVRSEDYHKRKLELCSDVGIRLAFVWEHDWKTQKDQVKESLERFINGVELSETPLLTKCISDSDLKQDFL